ncbi:hypothetical protein [Leifsonia sp. NPDC077715]|uniref:hypothetical protein n=1 Tax=Leifsonia sp. NPDC077715 TaxID=3155539 RepID=UPI00344A129B
MPEPEDEQSQAEGPTPSARGGADDPEASATSAHANPDPLGWKSKGEYLATRPQSEAPRPTRWWGIAFAIFLLVWIIDMFLLGSLTAVKGDPEYASKFVQGKPIATAALFGMIVTYFGVVVCIWGVKAWKGRSRTMLILGLIAVVNPFSAIILLWVAFCGWSGCYAP